MQMLPYIHSPHDLHGLDNAALKEVAKEIRQTIIDVLSVHGGHLASNLGIVELTVALHAVFNAPQDKIIFDVSHQSYPHKLLTGRYNRFSTIRQYKGLCGFSHPRESLHDHFFAGHAGTALSLGLGMAKARDLQGGQYHVLPILGDASLTCGLTLEALNNIPRDLKKFLLILNDNNMSISQNVGAITNILSRFLSNPTSNRIYREIETLLSKIPNIGTSLAKQGHKCKESLKNLVSTAPFFEQFGLSYVGPIDGHDIDKLVHTLQALKNTNTPTLLHVLTTKGKGMDTATHNPTTYHGCKPFDKETGLFHTLHNNKPSFPQVFGKHLLHLARQDEEIVVLTPAMTAGSCLDPIFREFPDRCIDVGIAEGHCVTYAGAIAKNQGMRVVCSIYATFLQRALDNLFHDVCLQESPVVFAIDRAGISGPDGSTHHGIFDISFLQAMPGMVICQPRDGHVLKELLESSFSWARPTAIRYPNMLTEEPNLPILPRTLGKAEILAEGRELLILGLGHMNHVAMRLKERLQQEGIYPTVVDPVFIKPLDEELLLQLIPRHPFVITLEEHAVQGGLGTAIQAFCAKHGLFPEHKLLNLGIPDHFLDHGSYQDILREAGLAEETIFQTILAEVSLETV
ncbi:MAG: 1-deoxy-D-xylulose-5-phosphate synthase [Chlamydiae bacterium]|nr:1-deoxy-D-xylulose-5-phosphate synthase [Chlamydiota bacterium]